MYTVCIQYVYRLCVLICAQCVPIIRDGVSHCQEMSQRMRKDVSLVQDHHHHHIAPSPYTIVSLSAAVQIRLAILLRIY